MSTLLWYRFRVLWKQFKALTWVLLITAAVVLVVGIVCTATNNNETMDHYYFGFAIGFLSIYSAMIPVFMLQIEEQEKNVDLLLILPVTRKQTALVNYIVTWICAVVVGIYALLLSIVLQDGVEMVLFSVGIILLINTIYIPLSIWLGAQRSAIVLFILGALICIGGSEWGEQLEKSLPVSGSVLLVIAAVLLVILHLVSISISILQHQKKDF
ncbi:MAG: ABC-2 transporter permease [Oscillospiraceae bacterium]|nr:ABC-2 transporter permease [Oscillospiraceae bacterium]